MENESMGEISNRGPMPKNDAAIGSLTPGVIRLLAAAAGLTIGNIYYNQSLLPQIGREFHLGASVTGSLAAATQLGYASGLLFLVPLGDSVERRSLLITTTTITALAMLGIAFAPNFAFAIVASYLVGLIGVTPILAVAYAGGYARPAVRGRVVGLVMSGLLVGVLLSRSTAGFIGAWLGWRAVFVLGAGLTLLTDFLLFVFLPRLPHDRKPISYFQLLSSLPPLLREPVLRRHALLGAVGFGAFSVFWTTLAFYLADRPEHYGGRMVGLFGLVAIAGALVAPFAGHFSDRLGARMVNGLALCVMVLSFLMMGLADRSLLLLALGVFIMDAGVQANHLSNQARVMSLPSAHRSRFTSIYMISYFSGGAIGSIVGSYAWSAWHWTGVWATGAAFSAFGLVALLAGSRSQGSSARIPLDAAD
jgi:predicted MFS family arabinose efflux permease